MYNYIFASTYKYYSRFKNESPRFGAACVVTVCQIGLLFLLLVIVKVASGYNFFSMFPNKFYFLPILGVWMFFNYRYYDGERTNEILESFNQKRTGQRRWWSVITVISFLLPIVLIAFLLKK